MKPEPAENTQARALGIYLKSLRAGLDMSLRNVEEASNKKISNAYLSQLENGHISKPSPNILHSLADVYGVTYEGLMERAGYISPATSQKKGEKHGKSATFAIENLNAEEEKELLQYLSFFRSKAKRS